MAGAAARLVRFALVWQLLAGFLICAGALPGWASDGESGGITSEQAKAIVAELRAIRALLEQQGGARVAETSPQTAPETVRVPWSERPALGAADAPVVVVEYSDYACPYCQRFYQASWPVLKRDFVDTGKVRWVVRDLPLAIHPEARGAAQAARCAGDQGRFWEMRAALFVNRTDLGPAALERHAGAIGLDARNFRRCLQAGTHLAEIDADAREAEQARITGTPTFVVGRRRGDQVEGRLIVGAQGSAVFDGAIRLELSAAGAGP